MSGDTTNAHTWADADVYVSFDLTAAQPADIDTDFDADWELVGLLNGDDGFTESRDEDTNDIYAWGGVLIATTRRNFKLTRSFTALEYNDTVRALVYPGSAAGEISVPRPVDILIAFETVTGTTKHRVISREKAQVSVDGDIVDNETDVTAYALVATIFPDADGVLFDEQATVTGS
jgi:hypothetical protein